ncbi:MAG TPA: hypothetical protein VJQ84_08170, partial [Solirubrobacterales bacterium]|nr:hypothetical protein [Solirubrobacterales bacterium]
MSPTVVARLFLALTVTLAVLATVPSMALAAASVVTSPATKVHHTTAVLNGHLDPDSDPGVTACNFQWGPTAAYGSSVPCNEGNSFASPADVTADLAGLSSNSTYHFRLVVETTSSGTLQGSDQTFTTDLVGSQHPLIASFGANGTSATSFGAANRIAIDQARHKLYVFDRSAKQIYGYDISSPPTFPAAAGFSTIALDGNYGFSGSPLTVDSSTGLGSSGNIYLGSNVSKEFTNPGLLYGFKPSSAPLSGFPV